MAFQRLNVRVKKSFPGLYSCDDADGGASSKCAAVYYESPPRSDRTQDTEDGELEDFGARLERCKGSPSKDSPSKRKKLFGSLRSLRSLANLHSSPNKIKHTMIPRPESPVKYQDACTTPRPMSPSLALLDLEQSPSDKPLFDISMHRRSVSASSLEVQHSSPMTVPGSARQTAPYSIFPSATDLPAGTIPDTPGPMQRAFNRDPANHVPWQNASPTPRERYAPSTPVLTPLPGTNLAVGDVDPEFIPLPPSVNPSMGRLGHGNPGYFDIPVDEQPQMDSTDMLNGLACLKLADEHNNAFGDQHNPLSDVATNAPVGRRGTAEEMRRQHEDAKLRDTIITLDAPQVRTRADRRKQQAKDLQENSRALGIPKHHRVLPLRLKQQDGDLQHPVRKASCSSEDWETSSGERSTSLVSEGAHKNHTQNPACRESPSSVQSTFIPWEGTQETENDHDSPVDFTDIIGDSPNGPGQSPAPEHTWGRHAGLYDGTGYGEDSSGPATPCEPDEGIQDVDSKAPLAPLLVDGGRSGEKMSNRRSRTDDRYPETVRESPFTAQKQRNYVSLESIYRAYAYPLGNRVASSRTDSTGGGRTATCDDER